MPISRRIDNFQTVLYVIMTWSVAIIVQVMNAIYFSLGSKNSAWSFVICLGIVCSCTAFSSFLQISGKESWKEGFASRSARSTFSKTEKKLTRAFRSLAGNRQSTAEQHKNGKSEDFTPICKGTMRPTLHTPTTIRLTPLFNKPWWTLTQSPESFWKISNRLENYRIEALLQTINHKTRPLEITLRS